MTSMGGSISPSPKVATHSLGRYTCISEQEVSFRTPGHSSEKFHLSEAEQASTSEGPEQIEQCQLVAALHQTDFSGQFAGQIALFLPAWKGITSDRWVLDVVRGYMLELKQKSVQAISQIGGATELVISGEIEALLNKGAVYEVSTDTESFYSRIFVVPSKGGKHRLVINLHPLNRFLVYQHSKMEGIQLVRDLLQREDWLTHIDLKDAYFAMLIHQKHQKYFRFIWKGKAYEFWMPAFRVIECPKKLLRPVVGFLREKGVCCVIYLDDILLMEQSREVLRQHTALAVSLLESLGFLINYPKSHLEPSQLLEYLGFLVDTVKKELKLPKEKIERIKKEATSLLNQEAVSARILARVMGRMTAAVMAVYPAPHHYRALQRLKHKALHAAGYDGTIRVSPEARQDLNWWVYNFQIGMEGKWHSGAQRYPSRPMHPYWDGALFAREKVLVVVGAREINCTISIGWSFRQCFMQ